MKPVKKHYYPNLQSLAKHYEKFASEQASLIQIIVLINTGLLLKKQCQKKLAKEAFDQALSIEEKYYGSNHIDIVSKLFDLSEAYHDLDEPQSAKAVLERMLSIEEKHYGLNHPKIVKTLFDLSDTYCNLDEPQQARTLLERILSIQEKHYGLDHPKVASTLLDLGYSYRTLLNEPQQAKTLLERALPLLETYYGSNHPHVARALANLGYACNELDDPLRARHFLERALPLQEQRFESNHIENAWLLGNLGYAYKKLGDPAQAKNLLVRAHSIFKFHFGTQNPRTQRNQRLINECLATLIEEKEILMVTCLSLEEELKNARKNEADLKQLASLCQNLGRYYHVDACLLRVIEEDLRPTSSLQQAEESFKEAITFSPSLSNYTEFAHYLLHEQHYTQAIEQLNSALKTEEDANELRYELFEKIRLEPYLQRELEFWSHLHLKARLLAYYLLVLAYYHLGQIALAQQTVEKLQHYTEREHTPLVLSLIGHVYQLMGYPVQARIYYERALALKSDYSVAQQQLVYCQQQLIHTSAIEQKPIEKSKEHLQNDGESKEIGDITLELTDEEIGRVQPVVKKTSFFPSSTPLAPACNEVTATPPEPDISIMPTKPISVNFCLGVKEVKAVPTDDFQKCSVAILCSSQAIALNPYDAGAYYQRGKAHYKLGQYEKALQDYDTSIKLSPNQADVYEHRGRTHQALKRRFAMEADFRMARLLRKESARSAPVVPAATLSCQRFGVKL